MVKIVKNMKKSFLHLVESVKSCGSNSAGGAKEYDAEPNLEIESRDLQAMAVRAKGPTSPGKPEPPPAQTA